MNTLVFMLLWLLLGLFFHFFTPFNLHSNITKKEVLFFFSCILFLGSLFTFITSYRITLYAFQPLRTVIDKANEINIYKNAELLAEPKDQSELTDLIRSFNHMLLRIKEQSEHQNAFFASASHELRTPLAVMLTRLQIMIKEPDVSYATQELYKTQIKEIQQLIHIVNDFLLMGEINNQNLQLQRNHCDLTDIFLQLIEKFSLRSAERNTPFKLSFLPIEEDFRVWADEEKLTVILSNLISNAVKYSQQNTSIDLTISKKDNIVSILISNSIREDINPQITDIKNKFYHSKPMKGEGSGLGLWISKQLADIQDIELFFSIKNQTLFEAHIII
ncbi:histidine kinase dimerization/phospho-acceptor domain-containing protein [Apibacter raozihei]|uniref:sensor histidine kinase n=1 Tax=Apibacter raozihei TaxID=2500547 RepID=UPI000FE2F55C|nr:ATP-binding protein [Apibacter raozihei]